MARNVKPRLLVELDLNSPVFQYSWHDLELVDKEMAFATFEKLTQLTWSKLYRDKGLKWEKIHSLPTPNGIDAL
jgi:hypothetical protein